MDDRELEDPRPFHQPRAGGRVAALSALAGAVAAALAVALTLGGPEDRDKPSSAQPRRAPVASAPRARATTGSNDTLIPHSWPAPLWPPRNIQPRAAASTQAQRPPQPASPAPFLPRRVPRSTPVPPTPLRPTLPPWARDAQREFGIER